MTVAGFLRVLASGGLLLAATTTTTTLVQPAGASSSTEVTAVCPIEEAACRGDGTCVGCNYVDKTTRAEIWACNAEFTTDGADSSTANCSAAMDLICCADEASGHGCFENDEFVEFWLCAMNAQGCSIDELTCGEDRGGDATGSSGEAAVATVGRASIAAFTCALLVPFLPVF